MERQGFAFVVIAHGTEPGGGALQYARRAMVESLSRELRSALSG